MQQVNPWQNDAGRHHWRDVMKKYLPDADMSDSFCVYGYAATMTTIHVLRACGNDLSGENLIRQASNMKDVEVGALLPGTHISSRPTNFTRSANSSSCAGLGKTWELFGDVLTGSAV
jgi:branched-chain amino acid transport system substrate-binding protein